jgi:hypothetical protein
MRAPLDLLRPDEPLGRSPLDRLLRPTVHRTAACFLTVADDVAGTASALNQSRHLPGRPPARNRESTTASDQSFVTSFRTRKRQHSPDWSWIEPQVAASPRLSARIHDRRAFGPNQVGIEARVQVCSSLSLDACVVRAYLWVRPHLHWEATSRVKLAQLDATGTERRLL